MTQTFGDIKDTLRILISDPKDQKWIESYKEHFINKAIEDVVSSEAVPYVRTSDIPIRNEVYEYDFPEDMLEPLAMMIQTIEGSIVVSSSWRSLLGSIESGNTLIPNDPDIFWNTYNTSSGYVTLRDIVSDDKFIFTPKYQADLLAGTVHEQEDIPDAASADDIWVDTYENEQLVYKCDETYSATNPLSPTITVPATDLAGKTALTFTYAVAGQAVAIKYVQVVLNNAGTSGTSSVAITGDADDSTNPLTYTFTLYEDDNSNDNIIALDPANLTIVGADAEVGDFTSSVHDLLNANQPTVTVEADLLPSATDLVFTYVGATDIKYVQIVITDGGPTGGVLDPVITGDANDRSNPLTYTFTIYDDTANDTIIALTTPGLVITGADATSAGSVTATTLDLVNPAETKWTQQVIHLRYNAVIPPLANDTDELNSAIPTLIRTSDCIAYIAAAKMLMTVKGDERLLIMAREFKKEYENILERSHEHRMGSGPPFDLEPA